jgi:hypothetical protein
VVLVEAGCFQEKPDTKSRISFSMSMTAVAAMGPKGKERGRLRRLSRFDRSNGEVDTLGCTWRTPLRASGRTDPSRKARRFAMAQTPEDRHRSSIS